jgi:hypothetical protein
MRRMAVRLRTHDSGTVSAWSNRVALARGSIVRLGLRGCDCVRNIIAAHRRRRRRVAKACIKLM